MKTSQVSSLFLVLGFVICAWFHHADYAAMLVAGVFIGELMSDSD